MRLLPLASAMMLTFATPVFAQVQSYDGTTVLARVNGTEITLGHLVALLERLPAEYQELGDDQLFPGMLDQLIDQAALADNLETQMGADDLRTKLMLENERNSILANRLINELAAQPVDEALIQAAYDERFAGVEPVLQYNASHILVETAEEAQAIVTLIADGADFATTAEEKSTGPSGPNGGSLGWFAAGQMVAPFQEAVETLQPGEVSGPVQTQFGWHVIKLNELRDQPAPTLEQVREELTAQVRDTVIKTALEEVRGGAVIERLDPDLPFSSIRESNLLDQ